jgi:SanA protein
MLKRMLKPMFNLIVCGLITALVVLGLSRLATGLYAAPRTYSESDVPARRVAIVFGAGLLRDGSPTAILRDRVQRAANLYFAGKAEKLLMSGDNRFVEYNEPESMRGYALELGVPDADIVLDYAGRRTYDTCYRAKAIFGLDSAILVTQDFHLPRAIFLCNMLGVEGLGVNADLRPYLKRSLISWNLRELPATLNAFMDVIVRPLPVLGQPEPIFPENAQ